MSDTIDPNAIEITNKSGVSVGGHVLRGCTRWSVRQDYGHGTFEVQLTLVTSNFRADLGPGSNGMIKFYEPKAPAETQLSAAYGAGGYIGVSKGTRREDGSVETPISAAYGAVGHIDISKSVSREDGSVETKHFGAGGAQ